MQTIKHEYQNMHPIFDALERFYAYVSDIDHSKELFRPVFDSSFTGLCETFHAYVNTPMPTLRDKNYEPLQLPSYDEKNVIVCFSGGKDSIAVAMKLREMGYTVFLYHAWHINPSFGDEVNCAREAAEILDMPIYVDDIRFSGHHDYMEHPMKNMVIANGALHYGIREGIGTRIVFGNYTSSTLDSNVFDRCAGDCMDMWEFYDTIIQQIIPGFRVEAYLEHVGDTLEIIMGNRELLDASLSCLCRHSLRPYRHEWVKSKFGVDLPKHRCGSCYKCCVEYLYMADHDLIEFSEDYYKYCLHQLRKVCKSEQEAVYTIFDIWSKYCFYPFTESKIADQFIHTLVTKGGIRWTTTESTTSASN